MSHATRPPRHVLVAASLCAGLLIASASAGLSTSPSLADGPTLAARAPVAAAATANVSPAPLPKCATPKVAKTRKIGNPKARKAAQRGLDFLAKQTSAWQEQHKCFGCHVQAVTIEAFAVGRHHQYTVAQNHYDDVVRGLTTIPGGARDAQHGFNYAHGHTLREPSKGFGGAALARHDQWVDQKLSDDLLTTAAHLLKLQQPDGSIRLGWVNPPVGVGTIQGVYQAIQTWKQAYARSADDRWLTAVQKSEAYVQQVIDGWHTSPPQHIQEVNYAVLALLASGVGASEPSMLALQKILLESQSDDGGWSFSVNASALKNATRQVKVKVRHPDPPTAAKQADKTPNKPISKRQIAQDLERQLDRRAQVAVQNRRAMPVAKPAPAQGSGRLHERANVGGMKWPVGKSSPFATGQTLYVLRMMGMTDDAAEVTRGTEWLIKHQSGEGGWSAGGFGKAEAMWGVLGLVSLDVLSLSVKGIVQGQHVEAKHPLTALAWDNSGAQVTHIEVAVDDVRRFASCGDKMAWSLDASALSKGKHIIDVMATNSRGEVSTRRLEVFAGDIYMTQIGSSFSDGGTLLSLRDIAPTSFKHKVAVEVFTTKLDKGKRVADKKVRTIEQDGSQGPLTFFWDGKDAKGKAIEKEDKFIARLTVRDAKGKTRQTAEQQFVHATLAQQRARYDQLAGNIKLGNKMASANTTVELLDEAGNVVQSTRSTATGQYRFKNIDRKKQYKVRVKKDGYNAPARTVDFDDAKPAEQKADFNLQ